MQDVFDLVVDQPEIRDLLFKKLIPEDWDILCTVSFRILPRKPSERAADEILRTQLENRLNFRGVKIAHELRKQLRSLWDAR